MLLLEFGIIGAEEDDGWIEAILVLLLISVNFDSAARRFLETLTKFISRAHSRLREQIVPSII